MAEPAALPTLKLYYFNIPGAAECIRMALRHAGIPFEDYRFKDGEFAEFKASGKLAFGQVPMLEVNGEVQLVQSRAIMRYVARLADARLANNDDKLYPDADLVVAARIDALLDQEGDTLAGLRVSKYKERFGFGFLNDEKHAGLLGEATEAINATILPGHLGRLSAQLEKGGTGWLAGTKNPSVADFLWVPALHGLNMGMSGKPGIVDAYPALKALMEAFGKLPCVQAPADK